MPVVVRSLLFVFGVTALALPATAAAKPHKAHVDQAVSRAIAHGDGRQRVIVRTRHGARVVLREHLALRGKHVRTEHPGIDALTVTVDASEINTLALDPSVESISIDADLTADADSKNSKSTPTSSPSSTTSTST